MSVATTAEIPSRKDHWNMAKPGTQVQSVQSLQGFTLHCWPLTPIYCGWFWFRLATLINAEDPCWDCRTSDLKEMSSTLARANCRQVLWNFAEMFSAVHSRRVFLSVAIELRWWTRKLHLQNLRLAFTNTWKGARDPLGQVSASTEWWSRTVYILHIAYMIIRIYIYTFGIIWFRTMILDQIDQILIWQSVEQVR